MTAVPGEPASHRAGRRTTVDLVLGIDVGTTGVKALLVDVRTGVTLGRGYCAYPSQLVSKGGHEQNPLDWWNAAVSAVKQAWGENAEPACVRAVGLSGHMHAAVLVDERDRWVRPAMTWADRRSAAQVRRLREHEALFLQRCANPVVEAFTAPKLAWLAEHEPDSLGRAIRIVQPKDALRHRLTGTWGTDVTDARGTLLYDVRRNQWDADLWRLCGADGELAPSVDGSADIVGTVTEEAGAQTGLLPGTPVVAGASDVACSGLGAGVVRPGTVYVNAGTAAQILAPLDEPIAGSHFVFGRAASEKYLAMDSVYAAGMSVQWAETLFDERGHRDTAGGSRMDHLASQDRPGAGGAVCVPSLLGTSAPDHDPLVRGAFVGLTGEHGSASLARAVLEGVAYACAAAVDHVGRVVGGAEQVRVGGGLARSSVWVAAIAAVQDVPVERVADDSSPMGAAILAGLGVGAWSDAVEASDVCVATTSVRPPGTGAVRDYRSARQRYDAAARALAVLSHDPSFTTTQDAEEDL